jgi:cell wall-associated NlpC family hydrolase
MIKDREVRPHGSRSGNEALAERATFKTARRTFVLTQRRPVAPAVATMLALTFIPAAFAWAAPKSLPASSLAVTTASPDSEASQQGDGPDLSMATVSSTQTPVRRYHRRAPVHHAAKAKPLPSRGGSFSADGANVVGRVAVVLVDNTPIHAGRDRYERVLSVVPRGQTLAISGETSTEYAVLMIDHSLGYLPKTSVQILSNLRAVSDTPATLDTLGLRMVQSAEGYLGVPYVWGGNTRAGIDCSGFVRAVYAANGIDLPRVSGDQATVGYDVPHNVAAGDWTQWAPGDRMYFACHHPRIDHTGMYIGNGLFIHASVGHNNQVAIDRVDNAYYSAHLVAVRRSQQLLNEPAMPGDAASQAASSNYPTNYPSSDPESDQER